MKIILLILISLVLISNIHADSLYVIQKGDCLWKIADRFYGVPELYPFIYEVNKAEIDSVYQDFIMPFGVAGFKYIFDSRVDKYSKAIDYLEIGEQLIIPDSINWKDYKFWNIYYKPKVKIEKVEISIKKDISDTSLNIHKGNLTIKKILEDIPTIKNLDTAITPVNISPDFKIVTKSSNAIDRGKVPNWFNNPQNNFQNYAILLANTYPSLRYSDCVSLAHRIYDFYGHDETQINQIPLPENLPFQVKKQGE
jgi:hypothetical protein